MGENDMDAPGWFRYMLFITGLIFIEALLCVLKGFLFYQTDRDADDLKPKQNWKQAFLLVCIGIILLLVLTAAAIMLRMP